MVWRNPQVSIDFLTSQVRNTACPHRAHDLPPGAYGSLKRGPNNLATKQKNQGIVLVSRVLHVSLLVSCLFFVWFIYMAFTHPSVLLVILVSYRFQGGFMMVLPQKMLNLYIIYSYPEQANFFGTSFGKTSLCHVWTSGQRVPSQPIIHELWKNCPKLSQARNYANQRFVGQKPI